MIKVHVQLEYERDDLSTIQKAVWWAVNTLRRQKPDCINLVLKEFNLSRADLSDCFQRILAVAPEGKLILSLETARLISGIAKVILSYLKLKEDSLPGLLFKPIYTDLKLHNEARPESPVLMRVVHQRSR
jgi:hypothetical protein